MLTIVGVDVMKSPLEKAKKLFVTAFSGDSASGCSAAFKAAFKVAKGILQLAEERGCRWGGKLKDYFSHPKEQSEKKTQKWLRGLFEYVSADEIIQFVSRKSKSTPTSI